jgi:NADPH-dependent 2,4-dienoyl-CoA reductase/sulfur reductase-like enzyme
MLSNVKQPSYVPHASDAIHQGDVAAVNLAAPRVKLKKSQGTYRLNFIDELTVCVTGITLAKAKLEGFECDEVFIRNDYVNGNGYYDMRMVYEEGTHKILGMQCIGMDGELARLADIVSLAIQEGLSVEDIEYTDFYFKHGFGNPRSFAQIAADRIRRKEKMKLSH